ncbi:hypothetical protein K466DRAFT_127612 [Polyporus arcularius HHB13444]|uniref:Uncharacterized protein n=1 Tax=Polyporus arcularius HHB13444 TaxID=1314778 RepID=A0A5C3PER1_9APHY|nr:hypothetical protein K466DRAFT_127612 [Polyporus arcularius HHB13444]
MELLLDKPKCFSNLYFILRGQTWTYGRRMQGTQLTSSSRRDLNWAADSGRLRLEIPPRGRPGSAGPADRRLWQWFAVYLSFNLCSLPSACAKATCWCT